MITDIFFIIIVIPIDIVLAFLQGLTNVFSNIVPDAVYNAFTFFIGYAKYFNGVLPVEQILLAVYTLCIFWSVLYMVRIVQWVMAHVPWIGGNVQLPKVYQTKDNNLELRNGVNGRSIRRK